MYSGTELKKASPISVALHLTPVMIPVAAIFGGGLVVTLLQSFDLMTPLPGMFPGLRSYRYLLTQSWFFESFGYSLYVAATSALISVVLGTMLAYTIWRAKSPGFSVVYKIPLIMPHITVAFLTTLFLSDSGFFAAVFAPLYRRANVAAPSFLFRGNGLGLIVAYVYKESSFAAVLILGVLVRIDARLLVTATNLGASRWMTFRKVLFPHLFPVVNTTFVILFLYSFGAFDIPYLLSESRPQMLSIYVYSTYFKRELFYRPVAAAALVCMLLVSMIFLVFYSRISRYISGQVRKL